jgi:hypothetical protein
MQGHPTASPTHPATPEPHSGSGMHPVVKSSSLHLRIATDGTWNLTYNGETLTGLTDFQARACIDTIYRTGQLPQPTGPLSDPGVLRDALEGGR